jgi:hypothetical protein
MCHIQEMIILQAEQPNALFKKILVPWNTICRLKQTYQNSDEALQLI